ncbi:MAG: AmmeMemoRadiSam system radical SAM enzyme [Dehalococcoidia bacterium]
MKKEAYLYETIGENKVHCYLCAHECRIADSKYGACRIRHNEGGRLMTLVYGRAISAGVDPIEKKPLYHFLPGSTAYSIATIGCNFRCSFCQNWQISQFELENEENIPGNDLAPEQVVEQARAHGCESIGYTYTEPTIFFEYAYDTARLAHEAGLANIFVTNGYMTRQAIDMIRPCLDAANIDLKSYSDAYYKRVCRARLQPVLNSIAYMKEAGIWLEVTTLVVPGENDSAEELNQIAEYISGVSRDIPWHISRFYPSYEFPDHPPTPLETLERAREIGKKNGLRYVYLGNIGAEADTHCPQCNELLVARRAGRISHNQISSGVCPKCGASISGVWERGGVVTSTSKAE